MSATAVSLTKEQRKAVEARLSSVALSAGAGCGKTFVLTERFLADLEPSDDEGLFAENLDPAKLHELIAITFTDRAAREMRERIRKKCYERLQSASSQRNINYWLKLLRNLDNARVSTIHAFCGALLRSNAVEAGLDPRFTVVEQAQADTLLAELIEDTLREKLSDPDDPLHEQILNLTEVFGLRRLQTMVAKLLRDGRSIDFAAWLARKPEDVVAIWDGIRREVVVPQALSEIADSPAAATVLEVVGELNGNVSGKLAERCKTLSAMLPGLATSKRPAADLESIVDNARIQGDGGVKAWPDAALRERFQAAAKKLRDKAIGAKEILEWDSSTALPDAKAGLELLALAGTVSERYNRRKSELAWLDFNDLLQRARRLLTDPAHVELQNRLAAQVRLLLVDECQDTDAEQVELIKALCGGQIRGGNLFYVGDYKQSIYRFRGADPSIFRQLREETPKPGRLPLHENFRSQPAILNFVNSLFCDVLSGGSDKSATNGESTLRYEPLKAKREKVTAEPAIEFLWSGVTNEEVGDSDESSTTFARKQEAEFIARRIRAMIDGKEKLASDKQPDGTWAARPVEYKDIAILFRALSDVQHYEEWLRRYQIDYYLVGGHAFYAQQEIYDIVNLLRALASSADTVSLAGVLRSPMFALTDEALFWLAQHPQGLASGLFADRLPSELIDSDRERVQFAAATLKHLRDRKDRVSITALLNEALGLTGYDAALLAEFMGERKLANLRKLLEQARTFDRSGVFGLADFIVQLSDFVAEMPREPLAATHPEGTNVVRLMTIHQSKGLEFPVVFVPDMNRKQQKNDEQVVWDSRLGPLVKVPTKRSKELISGLDFYRELNEAEERAERVRLLYVATTRAADYLVLSSGMAKRDIENPSAPWTKLLAERFDLETGRFVATLPNDKDYKTPQVKVTTELPAGDSPKGVANPWHDLDKAIDKALELARKFDGQSVNGKLSAAVSGDGTERLAEPILPDWAAQRRFSISRLNGHLQPLEEESSGSLLFADSEQGSVQTVAGVGGIDLGVLVHQALARIDFALVKADLGGREETIRKIVKRCTDGDGKRAELVDETVRLVGLFLQSDLAAKLASAKVVHRELEFLLAWPPDERKDGRGGEESPDEAGRYLQGFIDCLYQDGAGSWHIVDYKSNQVSPEAAKSAAAQFEMQLGVYALAVEEILRQSPAELSVHFLRPSLDQHFVWDKTRRENIIERVNQAITVAVMPEQPA